MHFKFFNHVLYSRSLSQYSLRVNGLDSAFIYSALMLSKNVFKCNGAARSPIRAFVVCSDTQNVQ